MGWYRLDVREKLDEQLLADLWQLSRDITCSAPDTQEGCAIFECRTAGGRILYFAPAAGLMAEKFGARPCKKPSPKRLVLVHGDARAWHIHFHQNPQSHSSSQFEASMFETCPLPLSAEL